MIVSLHVGGCSRGVVRRLWMDDRVHGMEMGASRQARLAFRRI
jgi:hypothetical protein